MSKKVILLYCLLALIACKQQTPEERALQKLAERKAEQAAKEKQLRKETDSLLRIIYSK